MSETPPEVTPAAELPAGLRKPGTVIEPSYVTDGPLGTGHVLLSRDDILKVVDVKYEDVEVPEWAGSVRVRGLTGRERDEFEASTAMLRGKQVVPFLENIRAKLVAWCVVDADGNQLFTQHDVHALGEKSGAAIDRIYDVASRLSGMSEEDIKEMEKVLRLDRLDGSS